MIMENHTQNNITEFLRVTLANGPVPVQALQAKARAAGLLQADQPISQCKPFRTIADKLGVKRYQAGRRWFWMLVPPDIGHLRRLLKYLEENPVTPESPAPIEASNAPAPTESAPRASGIDPDDERQKFIRASIENRRALVREADAEAKVCVAKYLETGDLADLFPEW
jgi:hypothetical protein